MIVFIIIIVAIFSQIKILLVFYNCLIAELEHGDPDQTGISFNLDLLYNITLRFRHFSFCEPLLVRLTGLSSQYSLVKVKLVSVSRRLWTCDLGVRLESPFPRLWLMEGLRKLTLELFCFTTINQDLRRCLMILFLEIS